MNNIISECPRCGSPHCTDPDSKGCSDNLDHNHNKMLCAVYVATTQAAELLSTHVVQPESTTLEEGADIKNLKLIKQKYYELIYAVGNKYPNETRHETALRYIKQAETVLVEDSATMEARPDPII